MAKAQMLMLEEFLKDLSKLEKNTDGITKTVLEAGAKAVLSVFGSNLATLIGKNLKVKSRSTGQLQRALGISKPLMDNNVNHNIKIGFSESRSDALPMYNETWSASSVRHILTHYIYTGNLLLQRYYNENFITKKTIQNNGELPMYHAEDTHEAIISKEIWERVQVEMESRTKKSGATHQSKTYYPFTGKIVCECYEKTTAEKSNKVTPLGYAQHITARGTILS